MAYEVELKAPLGDKEGLKKILTERFIYKGLIQKKDKYYIKDAGGELVRLRYGDVDAVVTAKERSISNGIEVNREIEFTVSSGRGFEELMAHLGFICSYEKTKNVELYCDGLINYELVSIEGLGDFIEIEKVVDQLENVELAREQVHLAFLALGFDANQIEKRPYKELIDLKNKNKEKLL